MKQKSRGKNKTLLLLITLLSTASLLSVTTFAWFTANKLVAVSTIQVNVEAQGGIQVSADGTNWKSIVNVDDLNNVAATYAASVNQIPATLEPVSTGANIDAAGLMQMYYGSVETNVGGDYILTATKTTETRNNPLGRFVAFDLFFRADSNSQLYLTTNSGVETPDVTDTGIKNATRVGFVILGNTALGSSIPVIQGLNSGVGSPTYIWEPNYSDHTAPAIAHAFDTYGITVDANRVPYAGVQAVINTAADIELADTTAIANPSLFKAVTPAYATVNGFSTYQTVFSINQGITKIRMYMWIEGQDIDCENGASGGQATFNVQLTTETP